MSIKGYQTLFGIAREPGGYGAAGTVTKRIPFLSETLKGTRELSPVPGASGEGSFKHDKLTGIRYSGDMSDYLRYLEDDRAILLPMRNLFGSFTEETDDCIYWPEKVDAESLTLCIDRDGTINEYCGGQFLDLTVRGVPNSPVELEYNAVAKNNDQTSAINTNSADWILVDPITAMFEDLTVYFNKFDEGGFGTSDEVCIARFDLSFRGDWIIHQTKNTGLYISQPRRKKWE